MGHEYEHNPTCPAAARFAAIWTGNRWKVWDHRHGLFVPIDGHAGGRQATEQECREAAARWNHAGAVR